MRLVTLVVALLFAMGAMTSSINAQGRGNGQTKKQAAAPKTTTTKASAPKTTTASTKQATKAAKTTVKTENRTAKNTAKADARTAKTTAKADSRTAKAETKLAKKTGTTKVAPVVTDVTSTTPTTTHVKNPKLESRLLAMLPAGMNIQDAAAGFKNWGQFVAAVHVSNNLGIQFVDLKAAMTGIPVGTLPGTTPTTTTTPLSLGQAVQSLKNTATTPATGTETMTWSQIGREVKKAEEAANEDLRRTRERS